jgi:hypothetical protein
MSGILEMSHNLRLGYGKSALSELVDYGRRILWEESELLPLVDYGKRWMMGKNISLTWLMRQFNVWHDLREVTAALHQLRWCLTIGIELLMYGFILCTFLSFSEKFYK